MRVRFGSLASVGIALSLAAGTGCRTAMMSGAQQRQDQARAVILDWTEPARLLAAKLIDEYGPPDSVEPTRLVWQNKHLWKNVTVRDQLPGWNYFLEQTVSYPVPAEKRRDLAAFRDDILASADGTELSARSVSEDRNYLAVNLAYEIIAGIKTPAEARKSYETTLQLKAAGKTSAFTEGLLFLPRPLP